MLKIQDKEGHTRFILGDDDTEPTKVEDKKEKKEDEEVEDEEEKEND